MFFWSVDTSVLLLFIGRREVDKREGYEIRHTGQCETHAIGAAFDVRVDRDNIKITCETK